MPRAKTVKANRVKVIYEGGINIRQAAGLDEPKTPYILAPDSVIEISETQTVDGQQWGKIEIGWILLDKLTEKA